MRIDFSPKRQMIPLAAFAAGAGVAKAGIDFFTNLGEAKKNKEELARLQDPFYKVQDEYFQNRNAAGELATGGLPQASKDYFTSEADRGLGTGISAIQEQGGNPNDVAKLFDGYSRSIDRVGAEDAQAQIDNIRYFMGVNKDLAGQKTTQFLVNELQPHDQKLKQLTQNISNARQNMSTAGDNIIGSLSAGAMSFENSDLLKKLFPDKEVQRRISDPVDTVPSTRPTPGGKLLPGGRVPLQRVDTGSSNQDIMDKFAEIEELLKQGR